MSKQKRHHYLSEFYLKGFTEDDRIWVFDRETGKIRRDSSHNTAVISDYYTIREQDGSRNTEVESILSTIETHSVTIIQKLNNHEPISESEKQILSIFIGLLRVRVPQFEKIIVDMFDANVKSVSEVAFATPERTKTIIENKKDEIPDSEEFDPHEISEFVKRGEYKAKPKREYVIAVMLMSGLEVSTYLWQMDWFILHTENYPLITTDAPFTILAPSDMEPPFPYGIGLIKTGAVKLVPLTMTCTLAMADHGDKLIHRELTNNQVSMHNEILASQCQRLVIGNDEKVIDEIVKKTKIDINKTDSHVKTHKFGNMDRLITKYTIDVAKYNAAWLGGLLKH